MMKHNNDEKGWVTVGENDGNADKNTGRENTFDVGGQKYTPYDAVDKTHRFPVWLKASVAKWWIPGAVFYFISFGFQGFQGGNVLLFILGLVWGMATDIFLNHFFREMSSPGHDYTKYIFCGRKSGKNVWMKFLTLPVNLVYGLVLSFIAAWIINGFLSAVTNGGTTGSTDEIMFAAGPLLYATVMFVFDMAFSLLRTLVEFIIAKVKISKAQSETERSCGGEASKDGATVSTDKENSGRSDSV